MKTKILAFTLALFMLSGCSAQKKENIVTQNRIEHQEQIECLKSDVLKLSHNFDDCSKAFFDDKFVDWLYLEFGEATVVKLKNTLENKKITSEDWHSITGNTPTVLYDMFSGALDKTSENYRSDIKVISSTDEDTVIRIVGDVSLAENWKIMPKIKSRKKGIYGVLSKDTVDLLREADIFLFNNEFTISKRGKPLANKAFTFRASPHCTQYIKDMGADIVSLANNHAYDFGAEAFADTLKTLNLADIPYIGAGKNIKEAAKPYYFIANGRKYAFSAATKAEKNIRTPKATKDSSGVMRTYDPKEYIKVIKNAEKQCDYNIAYVHWGAENSHKIENGLYDMGKKFIDAGADIVVGAHAHILQGVQFYGEVPIVYNLGNFIFNAENIDTGILEIKISKNGAVQHKFIPAVQKNCYTEIVDGKSKTRILKFMETISIDVDFNEEGIFNSKKN